MLTKNCISISIPDKPGRFFSLNLKQEILNEPTKYRKPNRIVAVADINGSFPAFCKLLIKCGVINKQLRWDFDSGHLVIVGNFLHPELEIIEWLWYIYSLEQQALLAGGYVHFILGNNEITHFNGVWRHHHPLYADKNANTKNNRNSAIYNGNMELWRWLETKNIMERIGSILFMHGSIIPVLDSISRSISKVNKQARFFYKDEDGLLLNKLGKGRNFEEPEISIDSQRAFEAEGKIDDWLAKFRVNAIVTADEARSSTSFFSSKLINICSLKTDENLAALLIKGNNSYKIGMNAKKERLN